MTYDEAKLIVALVKSYWPRFEVVEDITVNAYTTAFKSARVKEVRIAVDYLSKTLRWPPSIAEIWNTLRELRGEEKTADDAFDFLIDVAKSKGYVRGLSYLQAHPVNFSHLGIKFWNRLCHEDTSTQNFLYKDFKEAYELWLSKEWKKESGLLEAKKALKRIDRDTKRALLEEKQNRSH